VLAIFALHDVRFTGGAIHGTAILTAAAARGLAFIHSGLAEEFLFRGYVRKSLQAANHLPTRISLELQQCVFETVKSHGDSRHKKSASKINEFDASRRLPTRHARYVAARRLVE
jgi:hypothetical protein